MFVRLLTITLVLFPLLGYSQKDLADMVAAEKAFIEMARTQNRRDAFLFFLSDSAVTQGPAGPIKGNARIAAQPVPEDLLSWEIAYSDISASGDFGYNTGPWNYRPKKTDEKPVAFGQFNSVWKKQTDGSWKVVLDIGISHGEPGPDTVNIKDSTISRRISPKETLFEAEARFQMYFQKDPAAAYRGRITKHSRFMVTGHPPFVGPGRLASFIENTPKHSNSTRLGGELAQSGDMGYVYGTVDIQAISEGKTESKKATYLRIWKLEQGGWKIVLDVITF